MTQDFDPGDTYKQGTCPNCGAAEAHYVSMPGATGFYTCPHLYGPDGRRIDTSDAPSPDFSIALVLAALFSSPEDL